MILVTGAAGLIGSAVVRELNRRGIIDILLVDHLGSSDKWQNLRSLKFQRYIEKGDFLFSLWQKGGDDSAQFKRLETIIHLGACSSTTEKDVSYLIQNNYEYSWKLAQFAAENGIRMVYASSAATYGDGSNGYDDDEEKLFGHRPLNPYGFSKQMFDIWLKNRDFKPAFAGLKYFNIFGPNEYHKGEMQSLVLKAFRQIEKTGKIELFKSYHTDYKDGEQKRDFLGVDDAAAMTVYLALDNREPCGIFNIGSGIASTWLMLAGAVFEAMNKSPKIEFIEMPEYLKDRYQYYTCAPMEKFMATGYSRSITPLRDAVLKYVRNYLMAGELRA